MGDVHDTIAPERYLSRRLRSGVAIFGWFTGIGLLFFGYRYLEYVASGYRISPLKPLINELFTGAWITALLFPLVRRFARRFPVMRGQWRRLPLHAGALIVYSVTHTSLLWATRKLLYPLFGQGSYDYGIMRARYPMEFFMDVIAYTLMVSAIYLFDRHLRAAQLESKLAEARLENLRLQLQPHFLFNALNTISSAVYEDPRKADAMIARLSDLLRASLNDVESHVVSLDREMDTLDLYLEIMRQRFEDKLSIEVNIAPEVRKALVPHLLLQPLVENCIRHGTNPVSRSVDVRLTAERDGSNTRLRIRDHGPGLRDGSLRRGTGISNTAARLEQLYGLRHSLEFSDCEDGGLAVTVAIPYQT